MENNINFRIEKHYATISTSKRSTLELNRVSFGDYPAKLDLRRWGTGEDGERIPFKGLQLNANEIQPIIEVLRKILLEGE